MALSAPSVHTDKANFLQKLIGNGRPNCSPALCNAQTPLTWDTRPMVTSPTPFTLPPSFADTVWRWIWPACWGLGVLGMGAEELGAQTLRCHVAYAGAQRVFVVPPVLRGQEAVPLLEGATFVLHVVNKVAPFEDAAVKVSTYSVAGDEQRLLHQATYTETTVRAPHGFTGLQAVQGPTKAQELRYWCERSGQ